MLTPEFHIIDSGRAKLRAVIEGSGPVVVLVHGFPESWYSWRHQIGPIAEAGFQVVALDVRGYGGSDKPHGVDAYSMEELTGDIAGVAEALSPNAPVTLIGHDWGAPIVWNTALTRPDVVSAVAGLSVAYTGVPKRPFSDSFREAFTSKGQFFYQAWFQEIGPPEAEAEADIRGFLRRVYFWMSGEANTQGGPPKLHGATLLEGLVDPDPFPVWMSAQDLDYYTSEFESSGLRGPLNRYRNYERDFVWLQGFSGRKIDQPSLLIGGDRDPAFTGFGRIADPGAMMRKHATDVRGVHILAGAGHWTQQERPSEVTGLLLDWLKVL